MDTEQVRAKAGRKPDPDKMEFPKVGIRRQSQLPYLAKWHDTDNITSQFQELLERAQKFWPDGPERIGRPVKSARYRAPQRVSTFAQRNGYTRSEALAVIAKRYVEEHPEEFE